MINLLIADDENIIRQGLLSIDWKSIGINVFGSVDNGLEAVEILQGEIIDVVLTDIRMPGLDGLGVAKFVHEQNLSTVVILLSGYSEFDYARKGIQYNVMEYLLKPSDPNEITASVKRAREQIDKRRKADVRLKLLEAELGKRRLAIDGNGIILGEMDYSEKSKQILRYIAENYNKSISLSTLSAEIHLSTIYLSKVIKKATGYTFLEIVNAMRVHKAAEKIRNNSCRLSEIGESVCINDQRYFSQIFKKYYNKTPSAYKKEPCMPVDTKLAYLIQIIHSDAP